jgi:glycosyltransferase involved in cell wall biosynthesis
MRAAHHVVHELGRDDVSFTFMGAGDCYEELVALRDELGLREHVELPGRVPDETVVDVLSTAALGLSPDPKNPLNDLSTMNKTLEYMAFELPVVAFDLKETRVSAENAARYVPDGDIPGFATAIVGLLDDEPLRRAMGEIGRARIEGAYGWPYQETAYVGVYDRLVGRTTADDDRVIVLPDAAEPARERHVPRPARPVTDI